MSVPEGYSVAPTAADHLVKVAVPIPGRDPICFEAPKLAWLPPDEVEAYQNWMEPLLEAEARVMEWHQANDDKPEDEREPFPEADDNKVKGVTAREPKLRWIKPYLSAADYKTLCTSKKIPERTISWIVEQLTSPDITVGESSASADS